MTSIRFHWPRSVTKSELTKTTRHVLLTLSVFMNPKGVCYPSHSTLAEGCALSDRAVGQHLRLAEKAGWISVSRRRQVRQKWAGNTYQATYPRPLAIKAERHADHLINGNMAHDPQERSATFDRNQIPTNNPINNPKKQRVPTGVIADDGFEVIWQTYPRNPNSRKLGAYIEWQKLSQAERESCLVAAVEIAIAFEDQQSPTSPTLDELKYKTHLSNWLRGHKWDR